MNVETRSTCERHVTVTIPRADIERYFDKEFTELMPTAHVPGFRPGRAPRKLVEARFRKDIAEKVKSELLMDSLAQVNEEQKLSAISEPDFDLEAVELPEEGPLTFEFDIEVRPEFEVPKWKGLVIEKPMREFNKTDVDQTLESILARRGRLVPYDGPAEPGDYITTNLTFKHGDQVLASANEEVIRIRPVLSFRDGKIEQFDQLMAGVRGGQTRQGEAQLSDDAPNAALRGQKVTAIFEVLEVKKLEMPELTPELLDELGGFRDEAELRDAIRDQLARQLEYEQHRRAREQITEALDGGGRLGVAAGPVAAAEPPRVAAGGDGVAAERLQRRGDPRPRKRPAAEQHGQHRPGAEGALHPRAHRRGGGDRRRRGGLRGGDPADRRAERRVAAAGAGAVGKERLDGRAAKPDRRAEGDRADPRARHVQGNALRVPPHRRRGDRPRGRRRRTCRYPRGQVRRRGRSAGSAGEPASNRRDTRVNENCRLSIADFEIANLHFQSLIAMKDHP